MDVPERTLSGPSAAALGFRSLRWIALASACAIPVGLESFLPAGLVVPWAIGWVLTALALLALFFRDSLHSRSTEKREVALGYTTALTTANSQPRLFLLGRRTLHVLSGQGEPRPLNIRKDETEKALVRRAATRTKPS